MIKRALEKEALQTAKEFRVICITGPRQSGKTTFCRHLFSDKPYISLEDPGTAEEANKDGKRFLKKFRNGAVIDEAQRAPLLFNHLQGIVDEKNRNGMFILTGSNDFLLHTGISQSLAGRAAYIELLPFSLNELRSRKNISLGKQLVSGMYPSVVTGKTSAVRWAKNYISTYIERDIRLIRNIDHLHLFSKFLRLCAARSAQILNVSSLATDTGVDHKTIQSWLSILERSYIVFRLQPFHINFNKRFIKSPKLFFHDTGILCSLLSIETEDQLRQSRHFGHIFENFIVAEVRKNRANHEQSGQLYYFRDSTGNEVDLVLEKSNDLLPVEIKSAETQRNADHSNLKWFNKVFRISGGVLINSGSRNTELEDGIHLAGWRAVKTL